jgi:RNA polymerase sigma-70 factor (ECF subfamily)
MGASGTVSDMTAAEPTALIASQDDLKLVKALRAGDERAFAFLVDRYYSSLLRLAITYVGSRAVAEEVVQETWLGVLKGLGRFEGRSSLKTWIFRILTNTAKTKAQREGRSIPFSSLASDGSDELSVEPERFLDQGHPTWAGHWDVYPRSWDEIPENRLVSRETRERIEQAIEALPATQRTVIRLRDVEGFSSEEVCTILEVSEANQRVLLHRARSKVRAALEDYLDAEEEPRP